jgi:hypothetical protein
VIGQQEKISERRKQRRLKNKFKTELKEQLPIRKKDNRWTHDYLTIVEGTVQILLVQEKLQLLNLLKTSHPEPVRT